MGVPFQVDVNVVTHAEQVDALEKRLNALQSKGVDLKVKVDGLDKLNTSKMSKQFTAAGKQASQNFMNGVKSVKGSTSDLFGFAKDQKKTFDKISKDAEKVKTTLGYTDKESTTIAKNWHNTQEKASKEAEKVRQDNVKKTQKAQEVENRRYAQQQIAQMKQTAVQRNAHNKAIVDSGKERIAQLKQEQKIQRQLNEKESTANLTATRKAEQSRIQSQVQQKISQLGYENRLKNAHNQEIIDRIQQTRQKYESQQSQLAKIQQRVTSGEFEARTAKNNSWIDKYAGQNSESLAKARKQIEEINSLQKELQTGKYASGDKKGMTIVSDDQIAKTEKLDKTCKELKNTMAQVAKEESKTLGQGVAERSANSVATYMESNTKALKKYGEQLATLQQQYKSATTEFEKSDLDNQFKNLKSRISAEGLTGKSGWDEFKRATGQIAQFTGIYGALQNVMIQAPSDMVQAVKDYDSAMVNMQMATGVSNNQVKELMNTYADMGKQLKVTGVDVATSATEWMKQGKSIEESNKLAQDSIILSRIGDLSSDDATRTITAAMKSYNLNESQVMDFIDQISAIDMASATDVGGLADAFNEVAANANQAGISTKQLLSYAAVIGETTQEGMSSVGTSLNAIFSRMGNIKLARLKDYQNGGEDLSNVETVLKGVGISLRDADGEFKNFGDVLDETAEKYSTFGTVQQRAVAQAFAGTNHMNDFMVLMQQYSKAQEYMQTASDASGSSMEKYSAYTDSLEGKLEGLKSTFESLSNTVLDSNLLKGGIDSGTQMLNTIDNITSSIGLLNTAAIGLGIFQGKNNSGKSTWDSPHAFFKRLMPLESLAVMCTSLFINKDSLVTFLNGVGGNAPLSCYE